VKDSTAAYNEYAEIMLPKLKSRYVKKYSEVEVRSCLKSPSSSYSHAGRNKNELQLAI